MRTKTVGIFITVLGICMIVYSGFNFITTKKVAEIGSIQVNKEVDHPVQWSPYIGVVLLVGGFILISSPRRVRSN